MTTQTVHIQTYDYGSSLTSATLRAIDTDTLVATADTVNEVTADSGLYAAVFGEVAAITAGTYRLRAVAGGHPINRYVTLGGVDAEVVQSRSERFAELPPDEITALVDLIWDEPTAGHTTAGTYGGRIVRSTSSNTAVQITGSNHIAADVHDVQPDGLSASTEIIAILADTNELQSDWANGGRLDLILDIVAVDTTTDIPALIAAEAVKTANILDGVAWILADATGAIAAPQSATATAILTTFGATYTVQYAGLTSTGVRAAPTLSKV